jgi:hypothetical protein
MEDNSSKSKHDLVGAGNSKTVESLQSNLSKQFYSRSLLKCRSISIKTAGGIHR